MAYVWRGSSDLRRPDEQIAPGDEFEPSEAELRAFGDLIEEAESGDESDSSAEPSDGPEHDADGDEPAETCQHVVESTGEVCGRDRPCQYHSDDADDDE